MALLKMFRVAAATLMLAGVSAPAFAQDAPQTVEAVVAGCATGDCAALVADFLANVPADQLVQVIAVLGAQLAAAAQNNPAASARYAAGISAAASLSPDAQQVATLSGIAANFAGRGGLTNVQTAAGPAAGLADAGGASGN
ncbi:MAG: hypothetical protein ACK4HD_12715 [Pannonibacter phragmitetus]